MIPLHLFCTLRCGARGWIHRGVISTAIRLRAQDCRNVRYYTTSPDQSRVKTMEELLMRTVPLLPAYETRDKSPPPPESSSVEFMHFYRSLDEEQKLEFLDRLSRDFGVDHKSVSDLAAKVVETQLRDLPTVLQVEDRLRYSLTPRYRQLFGHISRVEGGVKFLVDLRGDLLEIISSKGSESPLLRVNNE